MISVKKVALLVISISAIMTFAYADDDLTKIKAAGVLKVGTEGTYPPFTYHDASGALLGFDVDFAKELGERLGVKVEFVEGKWDGLIAGLDAGRYDAVINQVSITEARKQKYDFSEAYIVAKAALIVRDGEKAIKDFPDLKGKKAAQSITSNWAQLVKDNGGIVVADEGFNQSVDLLLAGRVDATVNDNLSFLDFKAKKPDAKIHIAATREGADKVGVVVRKGNPQLLAAINKAYADAKADGKLGAISRKYFGEDVIK